MTRGPGEESVPTLAREQIDALVYGGRGAPPVTQDTVEGGILDHSSTIKCPYGRNGGQSLRLLKT